jgi:hypothetical protein
MKRIIKISAGTPCAAKMRRNEMESDIERAIASTRAAIKSLQEGLPYADHGAYGQDRERIRKLRQELAGLKNKEQDDARRVLANQYIDKELSKRGLGD